jgi:hexosaminidase
MKNLIVYLFLSFSCYAIHAQSNKTEISLIPIPVSFEQHPGFFILKENTVISVEGNDSTAFKVSQQLAKKLSVATGYHITVQKNAAGAGIHLKLISDTALGTEGYKLSVKPETVTITAGRPAGLFYGMQTLLQLLPKEIESKYIEKNIAWKIPSVDIKDKPRFAWRGLMFDVCRHFFTKEEVKQYIDDMVKYKYNLLHLHLTEDEGWRIEIKSLPNLTKVGAWRVKREGKWANCKAPSPDDPKDYGGFYTQDDIRELVQYAKDRFVNILPEMDMPGHSMAAVASYPDLSCTPGDYHVNASEEFMLWGANGQTALVDNTLCPANEKVYVFIDKVITEIAQLFPFEYIHIGGDECAKNFWQKNDQIKGLMEKEGLKTMEEVQAYFEKRVEKIIESKGKKVIGWDEILEGGLAPNASVMSWRGMKGGIAAAKLNHTVVMSPTDFTYLDFFQGEAIVEPPVYAGLRLNKVYSFEPVPPGVDPKFILGGQANLWTEQLPNYRAVQYMMWPRGLAVAECVWSQPEKKDWTGFVNRVEKQFERMDIAETKYAQSMYDPIITATKDDKGNLVVQLNKEIDDLDIYYSFDETNPDNFYPRYITQLIVPNDAATLKIITYRKGKLIGRQINMPVEELRKRAGVKS